MMVGSKDPEEVVSFRRFSVVVDVALPLPVVPFSSFSFPPPFSFFFFFTPRPLHTRSSSVTPRVAPSVDTSPFLPLLSLSPSVVCSLGERTSLSYALSLRSHNAIQPEI